MHTTTLLAAHLAATEPIDPHVLAEMVRPLTDDEQAQVDAFLAELEPLTDVEIGARVRIPAGLVPEFRRLMYPIRAVR